MTHDQFTDWASGALRWRFATVITPLQIAQIAKDPTLSWGSSRGDLIVATPFPVHNSGLIAECRRILSTRLPEMLQALKSQNAWLVGWQVREHHPGHFSFSDAHYFMDFRLIARTVHGPTWKEKR